MLAAQAAAVMKSGGVYRRRRGPSGFSGLGDDAINITPVDGLVVTLDEVYARVQANGGSMNIGEGDYLTIARSDPRLTVTSLGSGIYKVTLSGKSNDGLITSNVLIWGGLAVGAVLLLSMLKR